MPRFDSRAKSTGSARFGIDVSVPDMLNAAIRMAPSFTGAVRAIRNQANSQDAGVHAVVRIAAVAVANEEPASEHPGLVSLPRDNAVCVIADHFWQAKRALDALDVVFDSGPQGGLSTAKIDALLRPPSQQRAAFRPRNAARQTRDKPASVIERRFVLPHIAHAPLEPVNATAHYKNGTVEVWGPIQALTACQEAVAKAMGCTPDAVKVNVTFLGGSFGRKIVPDYVVQAVQASKAVGRPVKLIRTREEDIQHDVFRPNAGARLRAMLDKEGYPLAVHVRVAGQSLFGATRKSWLDQTPEGAWDESMVDGIYNQNYRIPNFLVRPSHLRCRSRCISCGRSA